VRLLPDSLAGRTTLVLLLGLSAFHLGSVWLHERTAHSAASGAREVQVAERLAAASRALATLPEAERDATAHALSSPGLEAHWSRVAGLGPGQVADPALAALRERLARLAPEPGELRLGYADEGPVVAGHRVIGAMALPDGSWLNFAAPVFGGAGGGEDSTHVSLLSLSAMAFGIVLVSVLVVRWITRPLRRLAEAADRFGRDPGPVPLSEDGPREVRHAARAFNAMQARIHRLVADRTQALAAVSHDLRTPITRLRLRAGFVEDAEAQARMDADLDEMEAMIAATLAYLRGEAEAEPVRTADVAAMLQTLVDDAADAGRAASYDGPAHAELACRPVALKRALANLVGNALEHGGAARVRLREEPGGGLRIAIEDDGPGIPVAELERVFEPFRRLDPSRSRATGGVGLGLTIARQAILAEGGGLALENRPGGAGLTALVTLPRR
jgi:signal transduction histidine kinase